MKHLFTILAIFAACIAQGQTPIQSYTQQPITIGPPNLGRDTLDNGYIVGRFAEYSNMIGPNMRTNEVTLQIKCYVRTNNGKPVGIKPVFVELKASANTYNLVSDGSPIGDINTVLNIYGIRDTLINGTDTTIGWKQLNGEFLTTVPVVDGWSQYTRMMDEQDVRMRNIIRQTMLRPYNLSIIRAALQQAVQQGNAE